MDCPVHFLGITWNRVDAMIPLLIVAITIGIIHVFLGLFIGIRNAIITKKRKHLYEKIGMLLMIIAIIVLVAMLAKVVPSYSVYPAAALIFFGLPLLLIGAGVFGTIEIMSTAGNILSYSRLMAIGMASVILAMVANRSAARLRLRLSALLLPFYCMHSMSCSLCSPHRSMLFVSTSSNFSQSFMRGAGCHTSRSNGSRHKRNSEISRKWG